MKRKHIFILLLLFPALFGYSQGKHTLSGIIFDSESRKALNGINILVEDVNTGTITNQKGSFLLYLNQGEYKISISGKGYQNETLQLNLKDDLVQEIELTPSKNNLNKTIKKKDKKANIHDTLLSLI